MSLLDSFLEEGLLPPQKEVWLAIRTDGDSAIDKPFGEGTRENPFAVNTPESFAYIMRENVLEKATVHLGPGIFHTRGMGGNGYAMVPEKLWTPKSGQKIIGSGMFTTTLRFTLTI